MRRLSDLRVLLYDPKTICHIFLIYYEPEKFNNNVVLPVPTEPRRPEKIIKYTPIPGTAMPGNRSSP